MNYDAEGERAQHVRFTIRCEPGQLILAARAAQYGEADMPHRHAGIIYESGAEFLVRRTRTGGISVTQAGG